MNHLSSITPGGDKLTDAEFDKLDAASAATWVQT